MKNDEYNSSRPSGTKTSGVNYEFGNTQNNEYSFVTGNKINIKDEINDNHEANNINNKNAEEESAKYNKTQASKKTTTKKTSTTSNGTNGGSNALTILTGGVVVSVATIITVAVVTGKVNYPKFEAGIHEISYSFDLNETNDSSYYIFAQNMDIKYYYQYDLEPGHNEGVFEELEPDTEYDISVLGINYSKGQVELDVEPVERLIFSTTIRTLPDEHPARYSFNSFEINPEVNFDEGVISMSMDYIDPDDQITNVILSIQDTVSETSADIELQKSLDIINVNLYEYLVDFNFEDSFFYTLSYEVNGEIYVFEEAQIQFINVSPSEYSFNRFYLNPEVNFEEGIITCQMDYDDPNDMISEINLYLEDTTSGSSVNIPLDKTLDQISFNLYERLVDFSFENPFIYSLSYMVGDESFDFIESEAIEFVNRSTRESYINGIISDNAVDYGTGEFMFMLDCYNAGDGVIEDIYLNVEVYSETGESTYGKYVIEEFVDYEYTYSINLYRDNIDEEHERNVIDASVLESQFKTILTLTYLQNGEEQSIADEVILSDTRFSGLTSFSLDPSIVSDEEVEFYVPLSFEFLDEKSKYMTDEFLISFDVNDGNMDEPVTGGVTCSFLYIPEGYQFVDLAEVMTGLSINVGTESSEDYRPLQEGDELKYTVYARTREEEYEAIYTSVTEIAYNSYDQIYGGYVLDNTIADGCMMLNLVAANYNFTYSEFYIEGILNEDESVRFYINFDYFLSLEAQSISITGDRTYKEIEDNTDPENPIKGTQYTSDEWSVFAENYFNEGHKFTLNLVGTDREHTTIDRGLISTNFVIDFTL